MDWEELKMSIRKTTARKGRRSKSRDPLKEASTGSAQSNSTASTAASPNNANQEISIDITLDMQQNSKSTAAAAAEKKRPPMLRRISGGWADSSAFKSSKNKKNSLEDDRFNFTLPKTASSVYIDDIPVIPDFDEVKDDLLLNGIAEPANASLQRIPTLTDLETDLLAQKAFTQIEGVNLTILARCLLPQNTLDEPDEVWEWDKLFTEVIAELNSEKRGCSIEARASTAAQKLDLAPDELPPAL